MTDIEALINELPQIVYKLKLTIGNSQDMMQQVVLINHAQEQLRNIQQAIAQELCSVISKGHSNTINTLSLAVKSLAIPTVLQVNPAITGNSGLITEKFGNPETEISLISLQSKINCWLEWGDLLQAIAADILGDASLVNQINLNINYPSLPIQIIEIENRLNIEKLNNHKLSHRQTLNIEEDLSNLQNRLILVKNTIQNTQSLLTIMIALSSFCGKSGFAIEWLDDAHELIISSNDNFQELTEILNKCDIYEDKINGFKIKIEEIKHKKNKSINNKNHATKQKYNLSSSKVIRKSLLIFSGLTILGFGGWLAKGQLIQIHEIGANLYQENIAASNFKAALKLGIEASAIAQKPPHALTVWQQAASKWQEAINLLQSIPEGTSVSVIAQEKLVRYRLNYIAITKRAITEKKAVSNLELAEKLAIEAKFFMETSPNSLTAWQQAKDKWQKSIKILESIPKSSSVYGQAQSILPNYKTNYAAINAIMQNRIQSVN
ncbi:hypothetical protein [Anabaena sp. UHCC 0399]|uniref:hypothetical protein n=1 Tax=Anabaena sp. UHCC 0399 TaxID=3110238 RepID=UPI002B220024|nr:hypothetical protein [Anabaena sp. UHCC 0399]MEA5568235.1 hypothetical protein [Anabaena sp. UHCC 0399]